MTRTVLLIAFLLFSGETLRAESGPRGFVVPLQSRNDTRSYGFFTLPNGMKVLLISDPKTRQAAAALSINAGSLSNPPERPGLAHFLEHMLFLGTRKYPDPNGYQHFIGNNGGDTNAGTGQNITNFSFSIRPDKLDEALDRFSRFWIDPLLDPKFVQREKHAVDSEYQMKRKTDPRRILAAVQQAYNPRSPYSRFTVGNLETLSDDGNRSVHRDLVDFFRKYHSANIMGLVVLGREDLATLRGMVEKYFAPVPNRHAAPFVPTARQLELPAERLPAQIAIRPMGTIRTLGVMFPVPSTRAEYRTMPLAYVGRLLGDTGKGSFYDVAHAKGWIDSLSGTQSNLNAKEGVFEVDMTLTREGLAHTRELLGMLYDALETIRTGGIERWRYEEMARLDALAFRYAAPEDPFAYVTRLADRLHVYPPEQILTGGRMLQQFDPDLIARYLGYLRADNALTILIAPEAETNATAPWYGTPYRYERLDSGRVNALFSEHNRTFTLPPKNPYIPKDLAIKTFERPGQKIPQPLIRQPGLTLWYKPDTDFGVPQTGVDILIRSPRIARSALESDALELWSMIIADRMTSELQQARKAGLNATFSAGRDGALIGLFGYSDTLPRLYDAMLLALGDTAIDPGRFAAQKRLLDLALRQQAHLPPFQQVYDAAMRRASRRSYSPAERLRALETLDIPALKDFLAHWLDQAEVRMLVAGNSTRAQAHALADRLRQTLLSSTRLAAVPPPGHRIPEPGKPRFVPYPVDHADRVLVSLDFDTRDDARTYALWHMISYLYKGEFYTQLRTRKQLGYMVQADLAVLDRLPGMFAIVESPNTSVRDLGKHFDDFNAAFDRRLPSVSAENFSTVRKGIVSLLQVKDASLGERIGRYFVDIINGRTTFDFHARILQALNKLTLREVADYYHTHMMERPRRIYAFSPVGETNTTAQNQRP